MHKQKRLFVPFKKAGSIYEIFLYIYLKATLVHVVN